MANKVIVLDAGHGYNTPGKRTASSLGPVFREWTLNDKVCDYIAQNLKGYNIEIHRTDDTTGKTDVSLASRVNETNEINPDLFVSIHHNSAGATSTGVEVYWHTYGTQEDKKVAEIIAPKLAAYTGLRNRGVKKEAFYVLNCRCTAVLVEGGMMSSQKDYNVITTEAGQRAYAKAVSEAIIQYLGLSKPSNTTKPYKIRVVNCDTLNARKGPGMNYAVADIVKKGTILTIVGRKGSWLKTKSGLYIYESYTQRI